MSEYGYALGQTITIEATFGSAPSSVLLRLVDPTGSTTTVDPVNAAAPGIYRHAFLGSKAGLWTWRFEGTGGSDPGVIEGTSLVRESAVLTAPVGPRYSYDPSTDVGKVRLYLDDRDLSDVDLSTPPGDRSAIFEDAEIQVFLDAEGGNVLLAAAAAAESIAANRNLLLQARTIGDQTASFGDARKHYLELAKTLRARESGSGKPAFGTVEVAWDDPTFRTILDNDVYRDGGSDWS